MAEKDLRSQAKDIIGAALKAVDPQAAMKKALRLKGATLWVGEQSVDLAGYKKIIAVGAGKAGAPMAAALEDVLGGRLLAGRVVVKDGHLLPTRVIKVSEASHPVPDERGVKAGQEIAALLAEHAGPETLVFCLLSGGGSALLVAPAQGVSLADKQDTTGQLLACGADIAEINTIRKHLSALKGGGLARLASPSQVISLIISDVVGDRLDVIASGPTVPDHSSWTDCKEILSRYDIWDKVPSSVRGRMEEGLTGKLPDTPKPGDKSLEGVVNLIIAGNRQTLDFAAQKAREIGYQTLILSSTIEGETKGHRPHARRLGQRDQGHGPSGPPALLFDKRWGNHGHPWP